MSEQEKYEQAKRIIDEAAKNMQRYRYEYQVYSRIKKLMSDTAKAVTLSKN